MGVGAKIILDSVARSGRRLVTAELRLPKCLLAEWNTHRMLSRNAASSRAMPVKKVLVQVATDPYIPHFGKNQKGMQAAVELTAHEKDVALMEWLRARDDAMDRAKHLSGDNWWWTAEEGWFTRDDPPPSWCQNQVNPNVHKQTANRLLEPFMFADIVASSTDWLNVFWLRNHRFAHPDIAEPVRQLEVSYWTQNPTPVDTGGLHAPYLLPSEQEEIAQEKIARSTARCARVSLENQDGVVSVADDWKLYERLEVPDPDDPMSPVHASPMEHVAYALNHPDRKGNFTGWEQVRKLKTLECAPEPTWDFEHPGTFFFGLEASSWMDWVHGRMEKAEAGQKTPFA